MTNTSNAGPVRWMWLAVAVTVGQFVILAATQAAPLIERVWSLRHEPALVRSARLSYGIEFTNYVLFLRKSVPEDALVVIPSKDADPVLGEMPFMQYFLFPRRLTNCPAGAPWSECLVHYGGWQTYVLAVGSFPPPSELNRLKEYLPFDASHGVYAPRHE